MLENAREFKITRLMLIELENLYSRGDVQRVFLDFNPQTKKREWIVLPSLPSKKQDNDFIISPQKKYILLSSFC